MHGRLEVKGVNMCNYISRETIHDQTLEEKVTAQNVQFKNAFTVGDLSSIFLKSGVFITARHYQTKY